MRILGKNIPTNPLPGTNTDPCNKKHPPRREGCLYQAGDGNRTHATCLEGRSSTIELRPRTTTVLPQPTTILNPNPNTSTPKTRGPTYPYNARMDIQTALLGQLLAATAMARQCIERIPDAQWEIGTPHRPFWRMAYHTLFYVHLYAMQDLGQFTAWDKHQDDASDLWPVDDPKPVRTYTRDELLEYCDHVDNALRTTLPNVDLDAETCGFDWYDLPKLDHMLLNLRHVSVHVGQLQERCYAAGVDLKWVVKG